MGQCTGRRAHWGSLFTELPLSHGWSDLKTSEICFHFWASSLSFLSDRITKIGWPKPSDGVQTKFFLWVPPILDDEWWVLDHITQNTLHPNNPLLVQLCYLNQAAKFHLKMQPNLNLINQPLNLNPANPHLKQGPFKITPQTRFN